MLLFSFIFCVNSLDFFKDIYVNLYCKKIFHLINYAVCVYKNLHSILIKTKLFLYTKCLHLFRYIWSISNFPKQNFGHLSQLHFKKIEFFYDIPNICKI